MTAKCIKLVKEGTDIERTSSAWLSIGKTYRVIGVYCPCGSQGRLRFRLIGDDQTTPGLYDAGQFEIIDDHIPDSWVAAWKPASYFELAPKSWTRPGFWEDFFDGDAAAVSTFKQELALMEE